MSLESATYIDGLVAANPVAGDNFSQGDDHLRLMKAVLKASFPGISGAATATHTEINYLVGVTSAIQTQFSALSAIVGEPYTWSSKTTTYTAVAGDALLCDTSGGAFTVTMPASPVVGNAVRIVDVAGTFDTAYLTVGRNGAKINGLSEDLILNIAECSVIMVYTGATYGWRAI
jgi:hypothetical protein